MSSRSRVSARRTSCGCRPRSPERCSETWKKMQLGEAVLL
jgi:hypothetical protein